MQGAAYCPTKPGNASGICFTAILPDSSQAESWIGARMIQYLSGLSPLTPIRIMTPLPSSVNGFSWSGKPCSSKVDSVKKEQVIR